MAVALQLQQRPGATAATGSRCRNCMSIASKRSNEGIGGTFSSPWKTANVEEMQKKCFLEKGLGRSEERLQATPRTALQTSNCHKPILLGLFASRCFAIVAIGGLLHAIAPQREQTCKKHLQQLQRKPLQRPEGASLQLQGNGLQIGTTGCDNCTTTGAKQQPGGLPPFFCNCNSLAFNLQQLSQGRDARP